MRAITCLVIIFFVFVSPAAAQIVDGPLSVWRVGPMDRIARRAAISDRGPIVLFAARREAEPLQIIVSARGGNLSGVNVIASRLTGPGGVVIPASQILLFRVHYVTVARSSPRAPLPAGQFPDALIPFRNPYTGADPTGVTYDAVPFNVADGRNQPIWAEIRVPANAVPGFYRGRLKVIDTAGHKVIVPYRLRVWNFSLPKVPSLMSFFGIWEIDAYYNLNWGTLRWLLLNRRYSDILIDHRLAHEYPQELEIDIASDGSLRFVKNFLGYSSTKEIFIYYMEERGMSALAIPIDDYDPFGDPLGTDRQKAKNFVRSFLDFAGRRGWADRTYIYTLDEPESRSTYRKVRRWGALFNEIGEDAKYLVTEQPRPDDPDWGSLVGAVDIWVPMGGTITKAEARERRAAGDELWTYTAMVQDRYSPKWLIDYRPIEYRVYAWLAWVYGMTGLEYWETTWWWGTTDPWLKPGKYERCIAEGQLLYPGTVAKVGYDGPVPSMRFKWVRDSFDDYEYFVKLAALSGNATVRKIVLKVARNWSNWTRDPDLLMARRKWLGNLINKQLSPVPKD